LEYYNKLNNNNCKIILYCRVSYQNQKNDLKQQIEFVKQFCYNQGKTYNDIYTDIGSGLNYQRKNFNKLINEITDGLVNEIIIAHEDRLVRFGFDIIKILCEKYNTKLTIINDNNLSPIEEMTQDLISIIHVFSSRLYSLRKHKNKIREICNNDNIYNNTN
jgi:predicted site-specific integrase-resolvase